MNQSGYYPRRFFLGSKKKSERRAAELSNKELIERLKSTKRSSKPNARTVYFGGDQGVYESELQKRRKMGLARRDAGLAKPKRNPFSNSGIMGMSNVFAPRRRDRNPYTVFR